MVDFAEAFGKLPDSQQSDIMRQAVSGGLHRLEELIRDEERVTTNSLLAYILGRQVLPEWAWEYIGEEREAVRRALVRTIETYRNLSGSHEFDNHLRELYRGNPERARIFVASFAANSHARRDGEN